MIAIVIEKGTVREIITDNPEQDRKIVVILDMDTDGNEDALQIANLKCNADVQEVVNSPKMDKVMQGCRTLLKYWGWFEKDKL